jgi:hypothetical protein
MVRVCYLGRLYLLFVTRVAMRNSPLALFFNDYLIEFA